MAAGTHSLAALEATLLYRLLSWLLHRLLDRSMRCLCRRLRDRHPSELLLDTLPLR